MSKKKRHKENFVSSRILLELVKDEYTKERDRADTLDNKASFFMTLIVAMATIFILLIPLSRIPHLYESDSCCLKYSISLFIVVEAIGFVVLIIAFKDLYDAYKLTDYMRPNLDDIDEFHVLPIDTVEKGICDHYKTIVENNIHVNDKKCDFITRGIRLCGIGFLTIFIATISLILIIGG